MRAGSVFPAALLAALVAPPPAAADPSGPPAFVNWRYGEDYRYLRDPAARTGDVWEPLKYIPLDDNGMSYATLGGDLRLRYEVYRNNLWGDGPKPDEGYGWLRVMPYAYLHLAPNLRLFGQLIGAWADRSSLTEGPVDETGLDLLQGFAQLHAPAGDATVTLQAGRQLLAYGTERLIGLRFGPNVPQPFDGGLVRLEAGDWRVDGFVVRPAEIRPDDFDDRSDRARAAWSVYATRFLPDVGPAAGLDLYYIGYHRESARFDQGTGREERHTLGTRFFGSRQGWKWDLEGFLQFGRFDDGDIFAWSVASDVRYTFAELPLQPFAELRANVISGDDDPNDHMLGTFNALFPRGKYFGEIGLLGPYNLVDLHPIVGIDLGDGFALRGAAVFYWRYSPEDGIYGNPGNLLRSAGGSDARYIGTQAELVLGWSATRNLDLEAAYALFEPGRFIEDTGRSQTVQFVGLEMQFRF